MRFAEVEHRAVVERPDIIEQGGVGGRDRRAGAGFDGAELKPESLTSDASTRADPGEADAGGDQKQRTPSHSLSARPPLARRLVLKCWRS